MRGQFLLVQSAHQHCNLVISSTAEMRGSFPERIYPIFRVKEKTSLILNYPVQPKRRVVLSALG